MKSKILAGLALALSLLAPAFSAGAKYEVGALQVEQASANGPALILIPGLASGPWVWEKSVAALRDHYSIYLLTLPGFDGRAPQEGVTLESLQRDLLTLIETKHILKPVLAGHSLGGTLALAFAAKHSGSIAGVIAVDGLPVFPGTERMTGDRSPLAASARTQIAGQTQAQFAEYQRNYMKVVGCIDEATANSVAELSSRSDVRATAEFAAQLLLLDLRPQLPAIKVPVVEISPFHAPDFARMNIDEAGKTGYYRALLAGIERLEVVSISPARHFVMFDQPEKFAAALDRALASMVESHPQ
jgi:pimeloyl-ACP methyl ester carboxylesterase